MKRREAESIGDIMRRFLDPSKLDTSINARRLEAFWPEVVGPYINKQTVNRYVKGSTLHVTVKSAPLRSELMFNRSSLIRRLNELTGAEIITEIVFH